VANLSAASAQLADAVALLDDALRRLARAESLGDGLSLQDLDTARTTVARAQASRDGAAARRDLALVQLGHHTLRAPFPGEVASLEPEVGETVGSSAAVARVVDTSGLVITVGLLDDEVGRTEAFTVRDGTESVPATVLHVAPAADPRTLTWPVELSVPSTGGLRAGRTAQVTAAISGVGGVRVPVAAVAPDGAVWIVTDGVAQPSRVTILHERGGEAVVEGLAPGTDVVLRGAELSAGQAVTVVR
jgi:RND family efflux transporter MFP subunit